MASAEFQLSTYIRARLEVSESEVNTTNNTSKVTAVVKVWRTNSWSGTTYSSSVTKQLVIDGTYAVNENGGISHTLSQGEITVMSGSKVITHNADGSKTITVSCSLTDNAGTYFTGSTSLSVTLTKIARQASLTGADNFTDEGNPSITYSNPAGTAVSSLQASIYNTAGSVAYAGYRDISKSGTRYTFNLTEAERNALRSASAGSNTLTVRFYVKTVIGSTTLYSTLNRTLTIVNATPTITSATAVDVNDTTLALTGSSTTIVKGYSNLKVSDIVASAYKRATLKSIVVEDISETYASEYTKTINGYAKNNVAIKVVDSRSNTSPALTKTLGFVDYSPIAKIDMTASRTSGVDETVILTFNGTWFNGSFGLVTNELTATYRFKEATASSWTTGATALTVTKSGNNFSINQAIRGDLPTGFNVDKSYNLEVILADKLSSVTFPATIGSGSPAISILGNKVALGGKFDTELGLDVQFRRCPFPIGYIYMSVSADNPSKYFGGTWEQIKDRFLLACGNTYANKSTGGSSTHSHTTAGHTLTVNEIPSHSHGMKFSGGSGSSYAMNWSNGAFQGPYNPDGLTVVQYTGGGGSHSHGNTGSTSTMPPYIAVYVWKRTK